MAYLALGAQGAALATSLAAGQVAYEGAHVTGQQTAYAARFQGAVEANKALINSENAARASEARAEADEFNATVAQQLAGSEIERAGAEAGDFRKAQNARRASARAVQAASGIALEGSPMMVDEAVFSEIELGAQRIVHGGNVAATRLENQARLLRRSGAFERETAKNLRDAGRKTADWAVEAGEIGAGGALTAADIKGRAALLNAAGDSFRNVASIGTTLTGRGPLWGVARAGAAT